MLRRESRPKRNDRCFCGSGRKYKYCHAKNSAVQPTVRECYYIDDGEEAVRYVISDSNATSFFSTSAGAILVFSDRATATAIATLPEFSAQLPGEINVASVGATKFEKLKNTLPFVEIAVGDIDTATTLVRDRLRDAGYEHPSAEISNEKKMD